MRDAVYRGTLVCTKLPFISKQLRTATGRGERDWRIRPLQATGGDG